MICATLNCPLLKTAELTRPLSLKLNDFSWRASSHQPRRGERETDSQQALLLPSVLIVYLLLFESVWRRSGEGKRVPGWEGCDEKVMKPVTSYYSDVSSLMSPSAAATAAARHSGTSRRADLALLIYVFFSSLWFWLLGDVFCPKTLKCVGLVVFVFYSATGILMLFMGLL